MLSCKNGTHRTLRNTTT